MADGGVVSGGGTGFGAGIGGAGVGVGIGVGTGVGAGVGVGVAGVCVGGWAQLERTRIIKINSIRYPRFISAPQTQILG